MSTIYTQADLDAIDAEILAAQTDSFSLGPFSTNGVQRIEALQRKRDFIAQQLVQESSDFGFVQTGIKGIDV